MTKTYICLLYACLTFCFEIKQVYLAKTLSIIVERSWQSGVVPGDWKNGKIVPIFKWGTKEDPGNNRCVSLPSVPGKLMEQILLGANVRHLEDREVI